ncbi:hypothetical protein HD597_000262 [Nonomuraea thailandensis]|uniref:Uncharacterized protein n=1 Tax=Nonomuraea thailandensis TaxID=1188745 RepID=A0A9X2JXN3_9ACTN|nr:hypothetical protein [Nonomuraea thailandensis]MCP2353242.1 hypothetical protein [Nonomuraea thailandensis]
MSPKQERGEQDAVLACRQGHLAAVDLHLKRPEQAESDVGMRH